MSAHSEHAKRVRPARPCCAHDYNFGGSCFNCGFDPARSPVVLADAPDFKVLRHAREATHGEAVRAYLTGGVL